MPPWCGAFPRRVVARGGEGMLRDSLLAIPHRMGRPPGSPSLHWESSFY